MSSQVLYSFCRFHTKHISKRMWKENDFVYCVALLRNSEHHFSTWHHTNNIDNLKSNGFLFLWMSRHGILILPLLLTIIAVPFTRNRNLIPLGYINERKFMSAAINVHAFWFVRLPRPTVKLMDKKLYNSLTFSEINYNFILIPTLYVFSSLMWN